MTKLHLSRLFAKDPNGVKKTACYHGFFIGKSMMLYHLGIIPPALFLTMEIAGFAQIIPDNPTIPAMAEQKKRLIRTGGASVPGVKKKLVSVQKDGFRNELTERRATGYLSGNR